MITFDLYVKVVLPLDGYVFWVRADQVSSGALLNACRLNAAYYNEGSDIAVPATTLTVEGSFHHASELHQDEEKTYTSNQLVFSAESMVNDLNAVGPMLMYVAEYAGLTFAFSRREWFFEQAGIYHYTGAALYSDMQTQLVDDPRQLNTREPIVSNSLPIWLSFNGYTQQVYDDFAPPTWTMYPSFLIEDNISPPFAAVHIESPEALAAAPMLDMTSTHTQLVRERVRITIFGSRNFNALDFVDFVNQYSLNTENFGIANLPVIRDEKRTQVELRTLAMKKTIEFDVNYYQTRINDIAQQYIKSAIPSFVFQS